MKNRTRSLDTHEPAGPSAWASHDSRRPRSRGLAKVAAALGSLANRARESMAPVVMLFLAAGALAPSASLGAVVDPQFVLGIAPAQPETVTLRWSSLTGGVYQMLGTTNLSSAAWVEIGNPLAATGNLTSVEQAAGGSQRFWRMANVGTRSFSDDFEGGAGAWQLEAGWQVHQDGSSVLSGEGHHWANLVGRHDWGGFTLRLRVKLISGGIHLNYRFNDAGRYFIWFGPDGTRLSKQYWPGTFFNNLAVSPTPNTLGVWHTVEILGQGSRLQVLVDDNERLDYSDPDPLLGGSIALETLEGAHVHLDDLVVMGPPELLPDPNLVWVRTGGPLGGIGYDVRVHPTNPQILYVTDAFSGVSKSEDGGASWVPLNQGITSRTGPSGDAIPVFCLTIDPRNPQVIWIGTQGIRGVYRSTDGGLNWVKSEKGIPDLPGMTFRSFTLDPHDSNIIYAGTEIPTSRIGPDGQNESAGKIYKTTDGGTNWMEILDTGALVRWMAIDPTDSRILFAATGIFDRDDVRSEGMLKSTDGGQTWRNINNGLSNLTVGGMVMDPRNPQVLYAATGRHNGFGGGPTAAWGGVSKTTDGGTNWVEVLHRPGDYFPVTAITLAPSNPDVVYVAPSTSSFYRSRDGGRTWQSFLMRPEGASVGIPIAVTVDPTNPDVIYLNSYIGGVFKSADGGETWRIASQGYTGAQVSDVGIAPTQPSMVYAIGRQGVAKSAAAGNAWTYLNRGQTQGFVEGAGLSVNPQNPLDVLVACRMNGVIWRTLDGGVSWHWVFDAVPDDQYPANLHGLVRFARFRQDPNLLYAAGRMANETFNVNPWTRSIGVLKSTNGGEGWQTVNIGLPADLNVNAVAIHPADSNLVLAATLHGGVLRTTNGGAAWASLGSMFADDVRAVAFNDADPAIIYAGTENRGVFVSTNGGLLWQNSNAGLEPNASIRSMVVDPARSNVVWAADYRSGVYRSLDAGKTWTQINAGLRTRAVISLAISADGRVLYAATDGEGVFRLGKVEGKASVSGVVREAQGPVPGALVQVQAAPVSTTTDSAGRFDLSGLDLNSPVSLSAWAPGYYIAGGKAYLPGQTDLELTLRRLPAQDNPDYRWRSAFSSSGTGGNCQNCHADPANPASALPFDEWRRDAHGNAATNVRFLTMYSGSDVAGHRSPLTRYVLNPDYGRVPLPPDLTQPYYGPGYKLDFPDAAGNCAACHTPAAIANDPFGVDPTTVSGVGAEGVACDLCHKVWSVDLNPDTRLPFPAKPGVLSLEFRRPPAGQQFFAGPYSDVAPGDDTCSPLQQQSRFCAPCHFGVFWGIPIYNSFGEWLASPYSQPLTGKTCQDCHMPAGQTDHFARLDQGGRSRAPATIFSHKMPGASDEELLRNAVTLQAVARREQDRVLLDVTITNDKTGHHVPTDSPLRHLILTVTASDAAHASLSRVEGPTVPDWAGVGDPARGCYSGLPGKGFAKILEELWTEVSPTGAYWKPTRIKSDNRLAALASDRSRFVFAAPQPGRITVEVKLIFRRAFKSLMDQKGWDVPDLLMARQEMVL